MRRASDRRSPFESTDQRRDNQQHEEDEEQDFGDFRRGTSDAGKSEQTRDNSDNEE